MRIYIFFLCKWILLITTVVHPPVSSSEQRVQSLLPAEERLILRLPSQKQQVSVTWSGKTNWLETRKVFPAATRCHWVALEAQKAAPLRIKAFQAPSNEFSETSVGHVSAPSCFSLRRYFGFITKHPADHRFACHVFVSENSTKPLAESVGWVAAAATHANVFVCCSTDDQIPG